MRGIFWPLSLCSAEFWSWRRFLLCMAAALEPFYPSSCWGKKRGLVWGNCADGRGKGPCSSASSIIPRYSCVSSNNSRHSRKGEETPRNKRRKPLRFICIRLCVGAFPLLNPLSLFKAAGVTKNLFMNQEMTLHQHHSVLRREVACSNSPPLRRSTPPLGLPTVHLETRTHKYSDMYWQSRVYWL